ncbi:hypothetical protein PCE1_003027 [Barthelona sp. PCE]
MEESLDVGIGSLGVTEAPEASPINSPVTEAIQFDDVSQQQSRIQSPSAVYNLYDDLKGSTHELTSSVVQLQSKLQESLVTATLCTSQHMTLYKQGAQEIRDVAKSVVDKTHSLTHVLQTMKQHMNGLKIICAQLEDLKNGVSELERYANAL